MKKFLFILALFGGVFLSLPVLAAENIDSFKGIIKIYKSAAKDNGIVILPIIVLVICFYLWYTRGRDPKGRGIIIAQYDPPDNLTPAEVGMIIDERLQNKDITAEIIYLAEQGYLKIMQCENKKLGVNAKDFEFQIINNDFSHLNKFQRFIIYGFHKRAINGEIKLSDLEFIIYKDLAAAKTVLHESMVEKGYFNDNPSKIRGIYIGLGILINFFSLYIYFSFNLIKEAISIVVSGFIIILFGYAMPARTKKGVTAKEHILGLKRYMLVAEKRRIEFHNTPEKKPEVFEKLLPYAMVLGIEKQWAQQFEEIYTQEPSWYHGSISSQFSAISFIDYLDSFSETPNEARTSESSSVGGRESGFLNENADDGFGGDEEIKR